MQDDIGIRLLWGWCFLIDKHSEIIGFWFILEWGLLRMQIHICQIQWRTSGTQCGMQSESIACSAASGKFDSPFCISNTAACTISPTSRASQSRRPIQWTTHRRESRPHLPHKQHMRLHATTAKNNDNFMMCARSNTTKRHCMPNKNKHTGT